MAASVAYDPYEFDLANTVDACADRCGHIFIAGARASRHAGRGGYRFCRGRCSYILDGDLSALRQCAPIPRAGRAGHSRGAPALPRTRWRWPQGGRIHRAVEALQERAPGRADDHRRRRGVRRLPRRRHDGSRDRAPDQGLPRRALHRCRRADPGASRSDRAGHARREPISEAPASGGPSCPRRSRFPALAASKPARCRCRC